MAGKKNRKGKNGTWNKNSHRSFQNSETSQTKHNNKRKTQPDSPDSSSSTHDPPSKTPRISNSEIAATSTPVVSSGGSNKSKNCAVPGASNNTSSQASPIASSLSVSSLSNIEQIPTPEEIAAMTAEAPSEGNSYNINLKPMLDSLFQKRTS